MLMQHRLDRDGVLSEEDRVHVEAEGHGGIPQFVNPIHGFEPTRHADLDDIRAERSDVADDVHVTRPDVRLAVIDVSQGPFDVGELVPQDRKSTRLNCSHETSSYAVFRLYEKKARPRPG